MIYIYNKNKIQTKLLKNVSNYILVLLNVEIII